MNVSRISFVESRYVKGDTTEQYQIDVFGMNNESGLAWLCECKYRHTKMGMDTVGKAEKALEAFKQQQIREHRQTEMIQIWLVSTGGFTANTIVIYDFFKKMLVDLL